MNPKFYARVADEFSEYMSAGLHNDVFLRVDPETPFDEGARGIRGADGWLVDVDYADIPASMLEPAKWRRAEIKLGTALTSGLDTGGGGAAWDQNS